MGHHGQFAAARYTAEQRWKTHRDARVARFHKMVRESRARRAKHRARAVPAEAGPA